MSRNSSGTYTLPSGNPVVSGTLIEATWANNTLNDLASAMTDSLSRSGQGGMTAALRAFDGTSTVPGIAWGSETTTGFYRAGAGDTRLVITGSEVMKYLATGVSITGTLSASGNASVGGTLSVTGAMTLTANPTLSAGTANGVLYLNGSKVATSGSALTFDGTNLGVGTSTAGNAGTVNVSIGAPGTTAGGLQLWTSTTSSSYLQWGTAASGTSYYRGYLQYNYNSGSDYLAFGIAAAEQMRLTSTGLGIGTSSPTNYGAGYRTVSANGSSSGVFELQANGTAQAILVADNTDLQIQALGARPIRFFTNGNLRATLDAVGNLGLGVAPSAWSLLKAFQIGNTSLAGYSGTGYLMTNAYFDGSVYRYTSSNYANLYTQNNSVGQHAWHVAPSGTAGNAITFTQAMTLDASGILTLENDQLIRNGKGLAFYNSGNTGYYSLYNSAGTLTFSNGTGRMYLDASGNLGIGTTSTTERLNVVTSGSYAAVRVSNGTNSSLFGYANADGNYNTGAKAGDAIIRGAVGVSIESNNGTSGLRIDSSGNLLVGTTLAGNAFAVYKLNNDVINAYTGQAAGTGRSLYTGWYSATSTTQGTLSFNVTSNGNVTNTNNSYGAISDIKLKENIVDATPKLEKLCQVRVVNYNFKEGQTHKQIGVIAQELEQVFPGMVEEVPDRDEQGNDLGTTTKQVKYSVFVPMLIKALQEQQAIIEQLKADVAALKGAA